LLRESNLRVFVPKKDVGVLTNGPTFRGILYTEGSNYSRVCCVRSYSIVTELKQLGWRSQYCHYATRWTVRVLNPVMKARSMLFAKPSDWAPTTAGSLPGLQRPEHEADRPPPSSVEFENEWSLTYTPFACPHFMYWVSLLSNPYVHICCYSGAIC